MGGAKSANHSMELSTRNVIFKEWTGLRIVDIVGGCVRCQGWICSAGTAVFGCLGTAGIERVRLLSAQVQHP
jgi:hypothetical protein